MTTRTVSEPIATINITPLIDVLLVLLIMFIMTIPAVTHTVAIDLPGRSRVAALPQQRHVLTIAASGAVSLDGAAVREGDLPARLAPIAADDHSLLTIDAAAEARYETFDRVLAGVKRAGITRLGFPDHRPFASAF